MAPKDTSFGAGCLKNLGYNGLHPALAKTCARVHFVLAWVAGKRI